MSPSTRRPVPALLPVLTFALVLAASPAGPAVAAAQGAELIPSPLPAAPAAVAPQGIGRVVAAAQPQCVDGVIYDDGMQDGDVRFTDPDDNTLGVDADAVMRFDVGEAGVLLEQICVCWNRSATAATTFVHELVFFSADGPGGQPGTELAVVPATATNVTTSSSSAFTTYPIADRGVVSTSRYIYAGVRFDGGGSTEPGYALCVDGDGTGANPPIYFTVAGLGDWISADDLFDAPGVPIPPPEALMVRVSPAEDSQEPPPEPTCPAVPCVEDEFTLCLNDDRFRVQMDWRTDQGTSGSGMSGTLANVNDTGYFWFFNENNVEVVVKVLDACSFADRFWVFAGGLTNVEVEIRVCDTQEGVLSTYGNPLNTPFQPIQDTNAFATCP